VVFSPDGRRLAVAGRNSIKILDAASAEEMLVLRGEAQRVPGTSGYNPEISFSPDGKHLAAWCGGSVSLWSVESDLAAARAAHLRAAELRAAVRREAAAMPDGQ
jgi:WD40 repeat protein